MVLAGFLEKRPVGLQSQHDTVLSKEVSPHHLEVLRQARIKTGIGRERVLLYDDLNCLNSVLAANLPVISDKLFNDGGSFLDPIVT